MFKSLAIAAAAATTLALAAAGPVNAAPINVSAIADAKPANELVQVGFKKKHFGLHISIGGGHRHGGYYGHYRPYYAYDYGHSCRRLYWRWKHTGSFHWRKRYLLCIGAW